MSLLRIRNGELVFPEGSKDFYEAIELIGEGETRVPDDDKLTIVVIGHNELFHNVPTGNVLHAEDHEGSVYFFLAINEDDDGREVLVVWDDAGKDDDAPRWVILSTEEWVQTRGTGRVIRIFLTKKEAEAALGDDDIVMLPITGPEGYRGVLAHCRAINPDDEFFYSNHEQFFRNCTDERLIQLLGIPDGIEFNTSLDRVELTLDEVFSAHPFINLTTYVRRIIVTSDGGIFLVVSIIEGAYTRRIVGRQFTHMEARELLKL